MIDRTGVTRREALATMTVGAAAAALGLPALGACSPATGGGTFARPGLQLYTMRAEMERNVEETLARVAQIGYKEVEFAGYFGRTPAQVAANLKLNGLASPSAHVGLDTIGAGWDQMLDQAATIGHQWLIVAYLTEAQRAGGADTYKKLAADFNRAAAAARTRGISFAYHNHDFEFAPVEGGTDGQTILLTECDPALIDFELDLYWITKAGKDAAEYMTRHPGRFPLVHVKDMTADGAMADVGAGTIDFQKIIDAGKGTIEHLYVERDDAKAPFESITTSIAAMKRFRA